MFRWLSLIIGALKSRRHSPARVGETIELRKILSVRRAECSVTALKTKVAM